MQMTGYDALIVEFLESVLNAENDQSPRVESA
jgi:hypothetical protein